MPDPVQPREGEVAFAVSVGTLYDLTIGRAGWPVRFTKHSHPTNATLTLANQTPGGPILVILDWTLLNTVFRLDSHGLTFATVGQYLDFRYQPIAPDAPGPGTDVLRMYARNGKLYFKNEDAVEQQIPIGPAPGPNMRWAFWYGGG